MLRSLLIWHIELCVGLNILNKVRCHVKLVYREIYLHIKFTTAEHRVPLMGESLKVNYQVLWRLIDLHFLQSWHMVFTFGAVPLVLASKSFLLAESGETIVD